MDQSSQEHLLLSTKNVDQTTSPKQAPSSLALTTSLSTIKPPNYVRFYTCTFCEKGFSNAQALGGHMNIHRRDRARLRNSTDGSVSGLGLINFSRPNQTEKENSSDDVDWELRLGSPSSSSSSRKTL